eukprot:100589_1
MGNKNSQQNKQTSWIASFESYKSSIASNDVDENDIKEMFDIPKATDIVYEDIYDISKTKNTVCKQKYVATNDHLFMMRFIRQVIEKQYKLFIPQEIKEMIYLYWGSWIVYTIGHKIDVRNKSGIWFEGTITQRKFPCAETYYFDALRIMFHFNSNDEWHRNFKIGDYIDARTDTGKWRIAQIEGYKKALTKTQEKQRAKLSKLEGIFVHYVILESKWSTWIFIDNDAICKCEGKCNESKHKISASDTQSKIQREYSNLYQWIYLDKNAVCNCYHGRQCNVIQHKLNMVAT